MWSLFERAKRIVLAIALSIVPLVLLYIQSKDVQVRSILAWPVIEVVGAIEKVAIGFTGAVSDNLYKYFFIVGRADELIRLRAEILKTEALKAKIAGLVQENSSILGLYFNTQGIGPERREYARVIARAGAPMSRMLRIDKGSSSGIAVNNPVIAYEGVVGQILSVSPNFADVLLVTDASSAIEAKFISSGARGLLRGITSSKEYLMEVRDIDGLAQVHVGDIVVTSGQNSLFPTGIPFGKIISSFSSRDGLYVSARIKPFVIMDQLDHVIVLLDGEEGKPQSFTVSWPLAAQ